MSNKLETLAEDNKPNYFTYLQRMTNSIGNSSKNMLAILIGDSKSVLDVGCGSGVLIKAISTINPSIRMVGIDINQAAVDECHKNGIEAVHMGLHEYVKTGKKFDCVIFSSVLHEFSSYDEERPFEEGPIIDALEDAKKLLNPGGMIIIRDGVRAGKEWSKRNIKLQFKNPEDAACIERFKKDFADYKREVSVEGILTAEDIKELLFTITWGEKSWPREIQERFGILTTERWKDIVKNAGFDISTTITSTEEYLKYIGKIVVVTPEIKALFEEATIVIVGKL